MWGDLNNWKIGGRPKNLAIWVVIKAVGRSLEIRNTTEIEIRHNRSVWCWILITLQFKPEELSDLYSAANMSVFADANITGTFLNFWTHKVYYKLHQSRLQNFDDGGLMSGWSFVRVVFCPGLAFLVVFCPVVLCPVVFCPYRTPIQLKRLSNFFTPFCGPGPSGYAQT